MIDKLLNLEYIKDIIYEKEVNIEELENVFALKTNFIKDLNLEEIYQSIDICQTYMGSIQLKNQLKKPYETDITGFQLNTIIIKKSPQVKNLLNQFQSIQNTIINLTIIPEEQKSLISNVYFTDYFETLNKYEVALQGHIIVNEFGPLYNMISPIIIIVIPFILSKLMPEFYVNMFMSTFFIGIPDVTRFKFKTIGQICYTVCTVLFYCYNLYNSLKTSLRTKKVLAFLSRKLTRFNMFIDILNDLNKIIPIETCEIPKQFNTNCSKGQMLLHYLNLPDKNTMIKLLEYIGTIDLYNMCSNLTKINYSFVQEIKTRIPFIYLKQMSTPKNKITNDFYANGRNVIISGPNAAGKTTFMRSVMINIVLAQSLGIALCDKMVFSKFDSIITNITKNDDVSLSLFQKEIKDLNTIINRAKTERCLIGIDEMCSSTNSKEGSVIAYEICKKLGQTVSLSIVTTHLDSLKTLEKKGENFLNYHMKIIRKDGKVNYLYKFKRGYSNEMTAIDNINSLSIDIKKTK